MANRVSLRTMKNCYHLLRRTMKIISAIVDTKKQEYCGKKHK
jgi:hypothetical protein